MGAGPAHLLELDAGQYASLLAPIEFQRCGL
jgi:hypothetical protein